jgi:hypothetical protein
MNLPEAIAHLLLEQSNCVSSSETFRVAEWTFEGKHLKSVDRRNFLDTFVDLPGRDKLIVTFAVDSDPISFTSDKPENADTFLEECQSRHTVSGPASIATLKVAISKTLQDNAVSLYSLSAFTKTLVNKTLRERMVTFGTAIAGDSAVWVQLFDNTPPFGTGTVAFAKTAPAALPQCGREKLREKRSHLCHSEYAPLTFIPEDFYLRVSSTNTEFDLLLNDLCISASLSFLADITETDSTDGSVKFKWNGYKTITGAFKSAPANRSGEIARAWYHIYEWVYSGGAIADKVGLARNIMSLHWKGAIGDLVDNDVFLSLRSSYDIYLKDNVEQYLAVKNKLNDYLTDMAEKAGKLAESLGDKFEKSVTAFVSFFIGSILAKVLTDTSFAGVFNRPVAIIGFVIIAGSALHLCLSIYVFSKDSEHLEAEFDGLKQRYSTLLDATEVNRIFDKTAGLKEVKTHLRFKRNLFSAVWIALLVLSAVVVLMLTDWKKDSKPANSSVTISGPVQVQMQNVAPLPAQSTNHVTNGPTVK